MSSKHAGQGQFRRSKFWLTWLGALGVGLGILFTPLAGRAQSAPAPASEPLPAADHPAPLSGTEPAPMPPSIKPPPLAPQFQQQGGALDVSPVWQDIVPPQTSITQTDFYRNLAVAHDTYAALFDHPAWSSPLPRPPGNKLTPNQAYDGLAVLIARLSAMGDLPAAVVSATRYEGALVDAVKAFQARHGLLVDGVVGAQTLAALNVTPRQRVEQIERNQRRLEAAPPLRGPRAIVVNLPEFALRTYVVGHGGLAQQNWIRVIVGRAIDHDTPMFDEDIAWIEFSPYWNVPRSIARSETIPRIRRNPGYFQAQGFEFVTGDGKVLRTVTPGALAAVENGSMRLRQRPGPRNAMGDIKFVLPNNSSIYLHHTSSPGLFERTRRDFSHGCIRVEYPVALADFILEDKPQWTEDRIREAMHGGRSRTLRLDIPTQVMLIYSTVAVHDGKVHFFPDVYGRDGDRPAASKTQSRAPARPLQQHPPVDVPSQFRQRTN